jgi:hypothetical protein
MLTRRGGFPGDGRLSLPLSFLKEADDTVVVVEGLRRVSGIVLGDGAPMLIADSGGLAEIEGLSLS